MRYHPRGTAGFQRFCVRACGRHPAGRRRLNSMNLHPAFLGIKRSVSFSKFVWDQYGSAHQQRKFQNDRSTGFGQPDVKHRSPPRDRENRKHSGPSDGATHIGSSRPLRFSRASGSLTSACRPYQRGATSVSAPGANLWGEDSRRAGAVALTRDLDGQSLRFGPAELALEAEKSPTMSLKTPVSDAERESEDS